MQPGRQVVTAQDYAEWQAWQWARILEGQRGPPHDGGEKSERCSLYDTLTLPEAVLRLATGEASDSVEVEFARRTPATGTGRNSRPKRLIEGKATPVQLLWR
jgi:hypothetical protein